MTYIRTSLQRIQGKTPATPQEVRQMAAKAWHDYHILLVPLDDKAVTVNPFDRQQLENIGNKLYGERKEHA